MAKYRVVDADGHVMEQDEMWPRYLEPQYHAMAPRTITDTQGRGTRLQAGEVLPYIPLPPGGRPSRGAGGYDPKVRLESFIVSVTPSQTLKMVWDMDKLAMTARHILFQDEDNATYVRAMLEAAVS